MISVRIRLLSLTGASRYYNKVCKDMNKYKMKMMGVVSGLLFFMPLPTNYKDSHLYTCISLYINNERTESAQNRSKFML